MNPKLYQEAEKYIKEIYWGESHDARSKLNLPKIIEEKLVKDNKEHDPEYYAHREGVVHATSIAKCLRGTALEMLGAKKDSEIEPRKLGIFKAGNLFEDFIVEALKDKIVHKQREYNFKYKNLTFVGRSDYALEDDGIMRVGENKSVNSESFWMREREGTLVAWHNQIQLQLYMWWEREINKNEWEGIFTYISKDDCTIISAPVKFNQNIIDQIAKPAMDILCEVWASKNANLAPLPAPIVYSDAKNMYQKNFLCTYCDYHNQCDPGWFNRATMEVTKRNLELKAAKFPHTDKKSKPNIQIL